MVVIPENSALPTRDLYLLAYAQHMAATARSPAARRLFGSYFEQEKRWLTAQSGLRPPAAAGTPATTPPPSGAARKETHA